MKTDLSEAVGELGRRGELEQDKLFCLLLNMRERMRQELTEDPDYQGTLELERLEAIIDCYREHMRQGRDLFDRLSGWTQRMDKKRAKKDRESEESDYPVDTYYHMAVAEQEQELLRLYPTRFGLD